jgi:hypothetical protein
MSKLKTETQYHKRLLVVGRVVKTKGEVYIVLIRTYDDKM